jgi:type VI protein secretion system component VasK
LKQTAPKLDTALLEVIDEDLKAALWVQTAYLDLVRDVPTLTPATRNTLITGPGRDYVLLKKEVPGLYTQRGYDDYVSPAIKRRAEDLAKRFTALGENKPAWSIAAEMTDRYADDYAAAWNAAHDSFSTKDFDGLAECANALKSLCGRGSAIRELLIALREGRTLKLSNGALRNAATDDLKWLDAALAPLAKVPAQFEIMLQTSSNTDPVLDYQQSGKLDALVTSCNEVARAMDDALAAAPRELRPRYQAVLDRLLEGAVNELAQQAQQEGERLWIGVLSGYAADVGNYYPFNPQSVGEAPLNTVSRLFNPKSGTLWAATRRLDALRAKEITIGHIPDTKRVNLLDCSPEFAAALARAGKLRDALFSGGETISVKFGLTFGRTPGVDDISFATGSGIRTLNDPGTAELSWTQEKPTGVKLQARLGQNWQPRDYATQNWGLVRLLGDATRTPLDAARVKYAWKFTQDGKSADAVAELEFKSGFVLEPELFSKLALPEKVGR